MRQSRRKAFQSFASAAAMFGIPASAAAATKAAALPDASLLSSNAEKYWSRIREEQFLLPGWRAFLNNGSLGVAPRPVVTAVADYIERSAALEHGAGYPRWGYETLDEHRTELAQFFNCKKDELALVHNATEAICTVANGLDLKSGDEVLITEHEHTSGKGIWQLRAARHGIALREVKLQLPPKSPGELADAVISAIGPRTKVLSFSSILSSPGVIMPTKEICAAARAKGVITLVDAAHMHGQIPVNIADIGCDFMAGSPHKWLFAPAGCGLLYISEPWLDRLWPQTTTEAWSDKKSKAARFMQFGTNNRAIFEGMIAGLRFAQSIGMERIYARTHQLARMVYNQAAKIPSVKLITPNDDKMFGALTTFELNPDHRQRFLTECGKQKIWMYGGSMTRVATHIHTRPQDIELMFDVLKKTA